VGQPEDLAAALTRLDEITRRLRRECPWDREQDERSIVPHTVEEAYELADAAQRDDTAAMIDELGDVLFQVLFLSLLLEERGEGDLAAVAESCAAKLIRRHPHVYGDRELETAGVGITANTIRADQSRGRWPKPDDITGGANRWYGRTVQAALAKRRGYQRQHEEA